MNKNVIIVVSDQNYLNHARSLFSNLRNDCKYNGDMCLITYDDVDTTDFEKNGVVIRRYENLDHPFYQKFHIFDSFFKKWENVLYLDCDIMCFENIDDVFESDDLINGDKEPWSILGHSECMSFTQDNPLFQKLIDVHEIDKYTMYNAGSLFFKTSIIDDNTVDDLFSLKNEFQKINIHTNKSGSDQPIINIKFKDIIKQYPTNFISYVGSNNPTKAYHFLHFGAPWLNNTKSCFNMTYKEKYNENLKKWYQL